MPYYHVTPASNLDNISRWGLRPQIGERAGLMEQEDGIYLFKTRIDAEDAVANWLGDEFESAGKLALLEVTLPPGAEILPSTADFEIVVATPIPPDRIKIVSKDF